MVGSLSPSNDIIRYYIDRCRLIKFDCIVPTNLDGVLLFDLTMTDTLKCTCYSPQFIGVLCETRTILYGKASIEAFKNEK